MEETTGITVGLVEPPEYIKAEDYATHTNGLPKTNFDQMREMSHRIVDVFVQRPNSEIPVGGTEIGKFLCSESEDLEAALGKVNFNAFAAVDLVNVPREKTLYMRMCEMVLDLAIVYLIRMRIRQFDMPMELGHSATTWIPKIPSDDEIKALFTSLSELARQKDAEYGASWCKRGGIGAWFTTVRKFDRLVTQLLKKDYNIWDVSDDVNSTECLEETIKDAINYLLLILEKRQTIQNIGS
jgi:hypothetical protein